MSPGVRHLYVHLPFCAHRCGYCDFVTLVGGDGALHRRYVDALLAELELERPLLAERLETVFLGGGTPTSPSRRSSPACSMRSRRRPRSPWRRIRRR